MFLNQNQLAREVESISRITVLVDSKSASAHDRNQFLSVTLLRYGLEADLLGLSCLTQCVYRRVVHSLNEVDLRSYASDMKYLKLEYLRVWQVSPGDFPWRGFKRRVSESIHYKWLLVVLEKMVSSPAATLQWLAFDERLLLDTNDDISGEIQDYIRFEQELSGRSYPEDLTDHLSLILSEWLSDFSLGEHLPDPTFGPGAVAEWSGRLPQLTKAMQCVYDADTVRDLCEYYCCDTDDLIPGRAGAASFQNKIIFRPKNALKHRIISAEPCWLSWLQQAIKRPLYDYVEGHPRMFTWFSNQDRSREMALAGSVDGSYATIDFSSASDAITQDLVDQLFCRTYIHGPLLMTRSRVAKMPDGQTVQLHKFAPMGSATCFVTMDMVFLSICELAIRTALGRRGRRDDYVVYGDDVIIRKEAVDTFEEICGRLCLAVNTDKTYRDPATPHFYRESCGIEAADGVDITPLRYSRFQEPILARAPVDVTYWESVIDLMNRSLTEYWYTNVRSVLVECIKASISRGPKSKRALSRSIWEHALRVDYSDFAKGFDGPLAVVVPDGTATNYRCESGWDDAYQRRYIRVRAPQVKPVDVRRLVQSAADAGDFRPLAAALHLWDFKSATDRPSAADAYDYAANERIVVQDKLATVAGVQALRWVWTRYYPKG